MQLLYSIRRKPKFRSRSLNISTGDSELKQTSIEVETSLIKKNRRRSQFREIKSSKDYENIVQYQELNSDVSANWVW